jgi:CheY-like chemotaxis protein/HPt (histidine-containing phosphotransfer) domain-containing protein
LLEFAVEDTGIGLTENQRARIFNSFNQAEPSITRRFGGTGLGLAISKRLIKLMIDNRGGKGAELDVESTPGRGSRFSFQILLGVENSGAGQTRKSPLEPGQTAWAWVLEPLPESREALARLLERLGYRARAFPNAESMKALSGNELASTWPELILLNDDSPEREKFLAFLANAKGNPPLCLPVTSSDTNLSPSVLCKPVTQHMLLQALGRSSAPENMIEQSNSRQRLAGLHILLVEDNPINQELALRLLMDEGALVNAVENGQLALDALDAGPSLYDLVLMDVQMPVLNGLEATRAIRRRGMRIPILGLTANAYDSDRQACLDSGMNDVSSKPFDFEKLIDLILHHANNLQAPPSPASAAAPRSADTPQAAAAAPQALLDMPAALANMNNNAALHVRLLRDFSPVAAALGEKILSQDAAGAAQARDAAHQLKSNCALIGATRLASISRDIEDALRRDPAAVLDGETRSRFARCLGETLDAVKTFLAGAGKDETQAAPGAGAGHSAGLAADLDKLAGLLAVQDMDSLDLFDALSARHGQALHGPAWDALRNAMRVFDTAAALDAIRQLRPPRQDAPGL